MKRKKNLKIQKKREYKWKQYNLENINKDSLNEKKEPDEKPKEEEKKFMPNVLEKVQNLNAPLKDNEKNNRKEEKPKEEEKKVSSIADKIKALNNQTETKKTKKEEK